MEFFEKAHVHKRNAPRKDNKSDENVKKQLKQMLYGYKQSNIELIKSSADTKHEFDDSTSVSGFSDLNLTNSSIESDIINESLISNPNDLSSFDINEISLNKSPNNLGTTDKVNPNDIVSVTIESVSEFGDDIQSLSENMLSDAHENSTSEDDISLNSSLLQSLSENETDASESFDADGALATKILERLGKTKKAASLSSSKRNNTGSHSYSEDDFKYKGPLKHKDLGELDVIMEDIENCRTSVKQPKSKEYRDAIRLKDSSIEITESEDNISECNSIIDSNQSSPFVSVIATDMPNQSLDDILGKYKHSTMKNLPSDSNNAVFSNNTDLGLAEDDEIDLQIEEDVGSLVPEIDDDVAIDDIDLKTTLDPSAPLNETTVYDETLQSELQSEEMSEREPSVESIDTTFCNPVKVYYGKNNCVFVLKHPAEIFIHGKVKVKTLGGTVEVLGHILQDKLYEIYAPNYNFAQYLRTVESENVHYGLFGKLTAAGLSVSEAEEIVTTLGDCDGVISLQLLRSRKLDFVESNFTVTDLFSKTSKHVENCFRRASELLGCSLYLSKPWKHFQENASWSQAISCGFDGQSRGIICGGKGSGKSTFLRYYVNKLLAQGPVLIVDLDPGQCEFTVAGNVSATVVTEPLLGPNFTHLRMPEIMLNIGMINTMDNSRRYANAVETLITHCSNDSRLANMPWIVNTMGMTNAMGLKFISLIILQTKPTFMLQIDSKNPKKRFESHLYPYIIKQQYFERCQNDTLFRNVVGNVEDLEYTFILSHHTENSGQSNFSLPPRDERYLNLLAYFGELLNSHSCDLLGIIPYEVNLQDVNVGSNVNISADALTRVINGKVVALCQHTADSGLFTLRDKPLRSRGHGLIRGIDWEKGVLYLITPMSVDELTTVNTLVYADWMPELRGQEGQLPQGTAVPYRTASRYQQRQLMFAPRRRFNPLQLLKMSRNS